MLLIDLFDKDNILCPEWLSGEYLDDDWEDSSYSYEEDKHTWSLQNEVFNNRITYDGKECIFLYYMDKVGELVPFRIIDKDREIQC